MAIIKTLNGISPKIGKNVFLAENAVIIGDVVIGDNSSVWYGAVIRGDVNIIRIGENVNIQDNAVIHATYKKNGTFIGNRVSIAHGAIVHACEIKDNVLVGMNAVVLDAAVVESNSIIAAGAVVPKKMLVKSGSLVGGIPAKKIKDIDASLINGEINRIAENYSLYASWYK